MNTPRTKGVPWGPALLAISALAIAGHAVINAPKVPPPGSTRYEQALPPPYQPPSRAEKPDRLIGTGPTGYELWEVMDGNCIEVRGLSVRDFARLGTDVEGLKRIIEAESGKSCVLYEVPFRP
jgi:hypothetical protein